MKIQVIGCSTTWSDRPTSSYCINDKILVDAGEGTFKYYKNAGVNFENIKHIFITHMHTDHTLAVINHIYNMFWHFNHGKQKALYIYGPAGIKKYFNNLIKIVMPEYKNFDFSNMLLIKEIKNFKETIEIENLKINFFKLKHGELENIAYIFDDGKAKVGFSGDCTYTKELDDFVKASKTLFLECCDMKTNQKHLGYDIFAQYIKTFPAKKFYATHCEDCIYKNADKLGINLAEFGNQYIFLDSKENMLSK